MSLEAASREIREHFSEASSVLNHLRAIAPGDLQPLDNLQKSLRGLCLVAIYAAVERSANVVVEVLLDELSSSQTPSSRFIPSLHGILYFSKIKSLKDSGWTHVFEKSTDLFGAAFEDTVGRFSENPLAEKMQNVDGSTLEWLAKIFGANDFSCAPANRGRLSNLRERRNAVAHGRETASSVGERFTITELGNVYDAADTEITRFLLTMRQQCDAGGYVRAAA